MPSSPGLRPGRTLPPALLALGAIALWGTLAALGVALAHVPPFLLTGLALCVGGLLALPLSRFEVSRWRVPLPTLALGVGGLFGFHFLLFMALRLAPPVQANLINYLWPLFMVLLSPWLLPGMRLQAVHIAAALLGFAGAALVILGDPAGAGQQAGGWSWGYLLALLSALVWASYSLLTRRVPHFPTAAIGGFALLSGLLSLLCHAWLEPAVALTGRDMLLISAFDPREDDRPQRDQAPPREQRAARPQQQAQQPAPRNDQFPDDDIPFN